MDDKIFKQDAKSIVDLAFNNKLFKEEITRDDMNTFEELINFLLSSKFESYKKAETLFNSIQKSQNNESKNH
jgi:hypothetical protein